MANHSSTKQLSDLKRQFHAQEKLALRFRKQGDIMNYIRCLNEARRLRIEYHALEHFQKSSSKPKKILEEVLV